MSNAQKINILRKTLQAAAIRGDLSQAGLLGQASSTDVWQNPDLSYLHRQQHGLDGWQGTPALPSGTEGVHRSFDRQAHQQQDAAATQLMRDALRAQMTGASCTALPLHTLDAVKTAQQQQVRTVPGLEAQLLPPAGPAWTLPNSLLKDTTPSRALLASFLGAHAAQERASMPDQGYALHLPQNQRGRPGLQPMGGRARGSSSSIALNKEIMNSGSLEQLLNIVRAHGHAFDFFNISTAVSRVPKLLDTNHISGTHANMAAPGIDMSDPHPPTRDACHLSPCAKELADRLCALVLHHLNEFDGRGIANTAWAFAKLRYVPDAALPAQLCRAAVEKIHQFAPQNVSNLAWALVYMHYQDPRLLQLIKQKACEQVYEMKPQELANIMWALASHEHLDERTSRVLGERAASMASVFKEQELSNIVWAMGRAEQYEVALLDPLLAAARHKLHHFMPQGVSNMVWALGQLGHRDEALLAAVARHCPGSLHQYDSQALSNLATGLASLGCDGQGLMHAIADEAANRSNRMTGQHLVSVLAACANLGIQHDRLMAAAQDLILSRPACLEQPALASLAWAMSRLGSHNPQALEALATAIIAKMDRLTGQSLVTVAISFADSGAVGVPVLQAIASRLAATVHTLSAPQCMAVSWALLQAGVQTPEATSCLLSRVASCNAPAPAAPDANSKAARATQLCASLMSAAQSGRVPEASLHPMLLAAAQAAMSDMDAQQLASSCWAFASLGVLDVATLTAFENALDSCLTATPGLVGPIEVNQICEAHVMVASQLAQRVGLPLTALPQHLLPRLPAGLVNAAHAASATSIPAAVPSAYNPATNFNNVDLDALTMQLLGMNTNDNTNTNNAANQTSTDVLSNMWGADVSALAVLAASQAAMSASNGMPNNTLNTIAAPNAPQPKGAISPNTLAKWVSVWNAGGLGNGMLSDVNASNVDVSSALTHRSPAASSNESRSQKNSNSPPVATEATALGAVTMPTSIWGDLQMGVEKSASSLNKRASGSSANADAWGTAASSVVSCLLDRSASLEEAGGAWLPRDLLAGMPANNKA